MLAIVATKHTVSFHIKYFSSSSISGNTEMVKVKYSVFTGASILGLPGFETDPQWLQV